MTEDSFPASDFDSWAEGYDQDISAGSVFPFAGYALVLQRVVELAGPRPGMPVLDLGTGTGNLALLFERAGCELWCSDFSALMLEKARAKLPRAHFAVHDLRSAWPAELDRRFDAIARPMSSITSRWRRVRLCRGLVTRHLASGRRLVIGDISFPDRAAMESFAGSVGELWEQEDYWLADEALAALRTADINVSYEQVSPCAGVYALDIT
jgi:putative AdoMet-dependent methyltransferase